MSLPTSDVYDLEQISDTTDPIPKRRRTSNVPVRLAEPAPRDRYAKAPKGCECKDRAGYRRKHHEYDGDGRCFWCGYPQACFPLGAIR